MQPEKFIKRLLICSAVLLVLVAGAVIFVDPFLHFHGPIGGMTPVFTSKEYQTDGSIEHMDYDSIMIASSTAASINTTVLDELFQTKTIKTVANTIAAPTAVYYMEKAFTEKELAKVYYSFDIFTLSQGDSQVKGESVINFMSDDNPFNDIKYLWNRDVFMYHVPEMLIKSVKKDYDPGNAYQFTQFLEGSRVKAVDNFIEKYGTERELIIEQTIYQGNIGDFERDNLLAICQVIEAHPQTEFIIMVPPYSVMWWDGQYLNSALEANVYTLEYALRSFLSFDNVKVYSLGFERTEMIRNLDHYADYIHLSGEVTKQQPYMLGDEENRITLENVSERMDMLKAVVYDFEREYVACGSYAFAYEPFEE